MEELSGDIKTSIDVEEEEEKNNAMSFDNRDLTFENVQDYSVMKVTLTKRMVDIIGTCMEIIMDI